MGLRFRKSIKLGPFRLNCSKTGLGWSVGTPGARYTKMANGRTRKTASIPGTGISWVEESKKPTSKKQLNAEFITDVIVWTLGIIGTIIIGILAALASTKRK